MKPASPRFWHLRKENQKVIESYCLSCYKFLAASRSEFNLRLVELVHRAKCKPAQDKDFEAVG
ncbi:MAG TPA: hypothetical protein VHN74_19385 [Candidatus Angelobacter sp.]|jgi:hypothetical protein|nr:hypothetical protein [Candidatus Angelobacter sp.]